MKKRNRKKRLIPSRKLGYFVGSIELGGPDSEKLCPEARRLLACDDKRFDTNTSTLVKTEVSKEGWIIETYRRNDPLPND